MKRVGLVRGKKGGGGCNSAMFEVGISVTKDVGRGYVQLFFIEIYCKFLNVNRAQTNKSETEVKHCTNSHLRWGGGAY